MDGPHDSVTGTATATADANTGVLYSAGLCAGADAATITVRKGGSGGTILCKLGAAIGLSDSRTFAGGVPYANLHVTVTGTTPVWELEIGSGE
jgi:hypothetical protein